MPRIRLVHTAEVRKLRGANKGFQPGAAFGHDYLRKKPEHVRLIGECLTTWTTVETYLAVLFSALLRADTDATIAVYAILRRNTPRHEAIIKAAEHMLDARGHMLIKALLMHISSLESERNDFAHGWWGISFDIEDGVAWIPQEQMTLSHVEYNASFLGKAKPAPQGKNLEATRERTFIYRLKDLQAVQNSFVHAIRIINEYRGFISHLRGDPPLRLDDRAFGKLKGFAPIRAGLEVLRLREEQQSQQANLSKASVI